MGIFIEGKYTKSGESVEIETFRDKPPNRPEDIEGFNEIIFNPFKYNKIDILNAQCQLFEEYKEMIKEKEMEKLYDVYIDDLEFAKYYLYENFIEKYYIIDGITDVIINKDIIKVRYKFDNNFNEYTFISGGYELLKRYRLRRIK